MFPGAAGHALPDNPLRTSSERSSSLALAQAPEPPLRQDLPSATLICVRQQWRQWQWSHIRNSVVKDSQHFKCGMRVALLQYV